MKKNYHYLDSLKEVAEKNGGKLLTNTWEGVSFLYEFELSNGYKFKSHYYTIIKRWPKAEESRFKTGSEFLKEMNDIAVSRGGSLISKEWKNSKHKYDFIDGNGIQFSLQIGSLRRGVWTPNRGLVSEPICKQIMEHLFGYKFIKTRKVLTKELCKTKVPLELDGYCEDLKIAFEYQGYPSHWDKNHVNYETTSKRDLLKERLCKELGIRLIIIPRIDVLNHNWDDQKLFQIVLHIIKESFTNKSPCPDLNKIDFKIDYSIITHPFNMLKKLKEIAENNNGKLLSTEWKGSNNKYKFQFSSGYEFEMTADKIISRGWPKNEIKYLNIGSQKLNELKKIAENNSGELLTKYWKGHNYLYEFKLSSGELFKKTASKIKKGWPKDATKYIKSSNAQNKSKSIFLQELQDIAIKNNGKLLSKKWINNKSKYQFESEDGVVFEIRAEDIRKRGWPKNFKVYSRTDEQHLNELKTIAEKSNIKLLENKWLGILAKYSCEFPDGRQFAISADMIKRRGFPKNADRYFKTLHSRNIQML